MDPEQCFKSEVTTLKIQFISIHCLIFISSKSYSVPLLHNHFCFHIYYREAYCSLTVQFYFTFFVVSGYFIFNEIH